MPSPHPARQHSPDEAKNHSNTYPRVVVVKKFKEQSSYGIDKKKSVKKAPKI